MTRVPTRSMPAARLFLLAFALALSLQVPLIANPGYFSFDELQWWARADVVGLAELPWVDFRDLAVAQYRPITFNLWLALAWLLASTPVAMHLAFALMGSLNAGLLGVCVRRFGGADGSAMAAAAVFVLTPYAAYTHGWTATLADVVVVACALASVLMLRSLRHGAERGTLVVGVIGVVALVAVALGAKESAVALPVLLIATLWRSRASLATAVAIALASVLVAIYLGLRWHALATLGTSDPTYAWGLSHVPARAVEYLLYPWVPPLFEIAPVLGKSTARLCAAAVIVAMLLGALARSNWRLPVAWLALYLGLLSPVLVLGMAYNHYAYLATVAAVSLPAVAWSNLDRTSRVAVAMVASTCAVHGIAVMLAMRDVGFVQQRFHADVVALLVSQPDAALRVRADNARDAWMLERFLHEVPAYRGVGLGNVSAVGFDDDGATHRMLDDGHVVAVERPPPPR